MCQGKVSFIINVEGVRSNVYSERTQLDEKVVLCKYEIGCGMELFYIIYLTGSLFYGTLYLNTNFELEFAQRHEL